MRDFSKFLVGLERLVEMTGFAEESTAAAAPALQEGPAVCGDSFVARLVAGLPGQVATYIEEASDPRNLVALAEALRLGRARCLHAGDDGLLVRVEASGDILVAARDGRTAASLISGVVAEELDPEATITLTDARWAADAGLADREPPHETLRYRICVYERTEPIPVMGTLRIEPLGEDDLGTVLAHYENLSEQTVRRHLADGWVFGGYDAAGELVGFIGEHDEGAIGMLEVFPEQRRHGYGFELAACAVNRMLAAGRIPYSQVVLTNEASFALHRRLGMTALPTVQCWCW